MFVASHVCKLSREAVVNDRPVLRHVDLSIVLFCMHVRASEHWNVATFQLGMKHWR
jgi:hypothetical protein